jgi:hypothetical protein
MFEEENLAYSNKRKEIVKSHRKRKQDEVVALKSILAVLADTKPPAIDLAVPAGFEKDLEGSADSSKTTRSRLNREIVSLSCPDQFKAPTLGVAIKKEADRAFALKFLSSSRKISDVSTKFNFSLLLYMDSNPVQSPIRGHLI